MTDTNNDNEYFSGGDFVFTQDGGGNIVGGGYKINSDLFKQTLSQTGGKATSPFENLAVPAGLFYVNMRVPKNESEKKTHHYQEHEMLSDDVFDKLFGLVEIDKKRKRKTRKYDNKHYNKQDNKNNNKKTRKYK
jgi:hypothetical protein